MKIVIEIKDREKLTDEYLRGLLARMMAEGSFSHPAYVEVQSRDHRVIGEIVGVVHETYDHLVPYIAPPLDVHG
jgi:hypothetical protein